MSGTKDMDDEDDEDDELEEMWIFNLNNDISIKISIEWQWFAYTSIQGREWYQSFTHF